MLLESFIQNVGSREGSDLNLDKVDKRIADNLLYTLANIEGEFFAKKST